MIHRLRALDAKLIDLTQDAYLWLYDRTGIYLATCCMALYFLTQLVLHYPREAIDWVFVAIGMTVLSRIYILQMMGMFATLNMGARVWREHLLRKIAFVVIAVGTLTPPYSLADSVSGVIGVFMWTHLLAIQLRARDPKDLFEGFRAPASAGAS